MKDKILLGYIDGDAYYLSKHSWNCDRYWGMGYIGNYTLPTHFDSMFLKGNVMDSYKLFSECTLSFRNWSILLDLFKQAYILKDAACVYWYGGCISSLAGVTDKIKNASMEYSINEDLEIILDTIWAFVSENTEDSEEDCNV